MLLENNRMTTFCEACLKRSGLIKWLPAFFWLVGAGGGVYAQEKITLAIALERTLANNVQLKKQHLRELSSESQLKEARFSVLPSLNIGSNLNFNFGRTVDPFSNDFVTQQVAASNGSISTGFPIFQGFQYFHTIAQNKFLLEAEKATTEKLRNDLYLNVVITYMQVLSGQDVLAVATQQVEVARRQLINEQQQQQLGAKTAADVSYANAQLATAELNSVNARSQLKLSFLALAQLMERNPADKFEVVQPVQEGTLSSRPSYTAQSVYEQVVENYPDIRITRNRALAAKKSIDLAKASLFPRLSFQGRLGSGYSSAGRRLVADAGNVRNEKAPLHYQLNRNLNQLLELNLAVPVFNRFSSRLAQDRAKLTFLEARYDEQLAKNNLNKIINQAIIDLESADAAYVNTQVALKATEDAYHGIEQKYAAKLVNSLELNRARTELNKMQFELIRTRYDRMLKVQVIDFYLGRPIAF